MADTELSFRSSAGTLYRKESDGSHFKLTEGGEEVPVSQQSFAGASRWRDRVLTIEGGEETARYSTSSGNVLQKFEGDDGTTYFKNGSEVTRFAWSGGQRTLDKWEYVDEGDFEFTSFRNSDFSTVDKADYWNVDEGGVSVGAWDAENSLKQLVHILEEYVPEDHYDRFALGVRAKIHAQGGMAHDFTPRTIEEIYEYREDLYIVHWPEIVSRLRRHAADYKDVTIEETFVTAKSL